MWSGRMERVMGIEPTLFAWEARVLPLNDTRKCFSLASLASLSGLVLPL